MMDRIGQRIGSYRLIRLLGQGGVADVYLGQHLYLGKRLAAIKILQAALTDKEIEEFLQEAQTLADLSHPHIVRLLDFAVEDNIPFLVMEYLPNGTMRTRMRAGTPLPLATAVSSVEQVASALHFAHERRVIHRDVKPENMLLDEHEEIVLSDFGIATIAHSTHSQKSEQETMGTGAYMAPEQIMGQPRPASDQYSLGICAYEWLCGQRPFKGQLLQLYYKHLSEAPPPLREYNPDLSEALDLVVQRALAKDWQQRYPSVQAFAQALAQAAQEQPRPVSSAATAVPARPFAIGVSMNNDQLESKDSAPPFVQTVQVATPGKEPLPTSEPTALKARIEQAESYDIEKPLLRQREPVIIPQGRKPLNAWEDTMRSQPAPNTPAILPITRPVAPGWRPTRLLLLATCLVFITLLIGGSVLAPNFFKELRGSAPQANALPSSLLTATARASVTSSSQSTVVPAEPAKGDYPMLGGNPAGTHQNAEDHSISPTNIPNLKLAWTGQTGGSLFSSPVIANGIVYIGSYDQRLYAYAAAGCSRSACFPLWSSAVTGAPITTSPAVAGGVVYITVGGRLYAYAAAGCGAGKTGCLPLWSSDPVEPPVSSPIIANGIVYFGSWDGKLYAYVAAGCGADKTTCAPLWSSELTGGPIQASPAVADGVVYIGSTDHKLYAYNAVGCGAGKDSCPPLWYSTSAGWYITTSPAVVDGIVYVSDRDTLYAYAADGCGMNATSCPPLWLSDATNVSVSTSPAVADGVVYVGGYNWLYAYKAGSDGTGMYARHSPLWSSQRMGGAILSPPFVANGIIYVSSGDHKLYAYNANVANCGPNNASCAPLWSSAPTGKDINLPGNMFSSPSIVNGVVYLGAGDGKLYAWHLPA